MTHESSNSLNFATLEQGKIYNGLQKKILDDTLEIKERTRDKTLKEGLTSSIKKRGYCVKRKKDICTVQNIENKSVCADQYGIDCDPGCCTETLDYSNQMQKLSELQIKFNSLLAQYQHAQTELTSEMKNYNDKNVGKNVYVNSIINNPTANFIGVYKNSLYSPSMYALDGGSQKYNYASCMQAAVNSGKTYFGLENTIGYNQGDGSGINAQCNISNDLTGSKKYGIATSGCEKGSDGNMYGVFQKNATALYAGANNGPSKRTYYGCFNSTSNDPTHQNTSPNMKDSGINMANYSSVYVLGSVTSPPWSVTNFPDTNAKWIWYVSNAQKSAPVNTGSPITFIYGYNYAGSSYVNATVYALNDDSGDWYLNSIKQSTVKGGWDNVQNSRFDITLSPGMNYLQCVAINNSGPAGLIATVIRKDTNEVLFNSNSDWKFTNIPVDKMTINASNYSVDTCQQYAEQNNFGFFGLRNGSNGTSQCVVGNNLIDGSQYGTTDPSWASPVDNQIYGLNKAHAIYKINNEGADPTFVGKAGYTFNNLDVSEYPVSMISKTDSGVTIIGGDASCPKNSIPIDSVAWSKMKKSGKMISSATKCGLADAVSNLQKKVDQLKGQLAELADKMIEIITSLKNSNAKINNQMQVDEKAMLQNLETYKEVSVKFGQYKLLLNNNSNLMVGDSKSILYYENYQYIFWTALAVAIIILTIKVANQK